MFFSVNGHAAENLTDLANLILTLDEKEFMQHHVRRDFSNWLKHILHKDELAEKLTKATNKEQVYELVSVEAKKENDELLPVRRIIARDFIYGLFIGLFVGGAVASLIWWLV